MCKWGGGGGGGGAVRMWGYQPGVYVPLNALFLVFEVLEGSKCLLHI